MLALHRGLHGLLDLVKDGARRALQGRPGTLGCRVAEQGFLFFRLLLLGARLLLVLSRLADGLRPQAGPVKLVQTSRLLDVLTIDFWLGPGAVHHDHLPILVLRGLTEEQGELVFSDAVGARFEGRRHLPTVPVPHDQRLLVLVPRAVQVRRTFTGLLLKILLPRVAPVDGKAVVCFAAGLEVHEHAPRQHDVIRAWQRGLRREIRRQGAEDRCEVLELGERIGLEGHTALWCIVPESSCLVRHHWQDLLFASVRPLQIERRAAGRTFERQVPHPGGPLLQELHRRAGVQELCPGHPEDPGPFAVALVAEDVDPPSEGWAVDVVESGPCGNLAHPIPEDHGLILCG
mmetsp:Transcript_93897/g.289598  ORF Transcript_93897/g.289598 Transcript_93897/m.289598 type:complete len:346 (+) Transcript_93897:262-1299(+)